MPEYSFACRTRLQVRTAAAVFDIKPSATDAPLLTELGFGLIGGTIGNVYAFGLGVPAAAGTGGLAMNLAPVANDPSQALANVTFSLDWAALPTAPTNFLRRASYVTNASAVCSPPLLWRFPRGIRLGASGLVLWCITGQAAPTQVAVSEMWAVFDS
jgi:hypothetical protein